MILSLLTVESIKLLQTKLEGVVAKIQTHGSVLNFYLIDETERNSWSILLNTNRSKHTTALLSWSEEEGNEKNKKKEEEKRII